MNPPNSVEDGQVLMTLYRANAQQAVRIRALELENSRLLEENLSLHRTVIHMQVQLDERDKNRAFADTVAVTQKKLQEKVAEVNELLRELEMPKERGMFLGENTARGLWDMELMMGYSREKGETDGGVGESVDERILCSWGNAAWNVAVDFGGCEVQEE